MKTVAIILTLNEELHLERCITNIRDVVDQILVVDSYSEDSTLKIAQQYGATVLQNKWVSYAHQFNWALDQVTGSPDWVLRIDADEYISDALKDEIKTRLPQLKPSDEGIYLPRSIKFMGRTIRYGGLFPVRVLRIFRYGCGRCENRWMDEHIKVAGSTVDFGGQLIDDNLNNLTWWSNKHNIYSSREAVDLLNLRHNLFQMDSVAGLQSGRQDCRERWVKENIYARLPLSLRSFSYFFYRYVLRLGFLDGSAGLRFHFLQGCWYRFLVDTKIEEVLEYSKVHQVDISHAIKHVLGIEVTSIHQ